MTTQTTLFPKTELDEATAVLAHLITEEEKADKASDAADQKVADTASRVRKQRHVVARLQAMMPAAEPIAEGEVVSDDVEDAEVLQIEGDVLDPITGEVVGKEALAEGLEPVADAMLEDLAEEGVIITLAECAECHGEGRLPDKTGGGHHKCKACNGTGHADPSCDNCTAYGDCNISQPQGSDTMGCGGRSWIHGEMMGKAADPNVSVVVVLYPGSDEPVVTKIGDRTRYSELVADYLAEADLDEAIVDYRVVTEDERTDRGLAATIFHADYGKRLIVEMTPEAAIARDNAKVGAA